MTALSVRDTQIFDLLRSGAPIRRVVDVGSHRGSWTRDDVLRVFATMQPEPAPRQPKPKREPKRPSLGSAELLPVWQPPVPDREPTRIVITSQQADVLTALCCGLGTRDMAALLHLSGDTVKTHLRRLFLALGVSSRHAAVATVLTGCVELRVYPSPARRTA